MIRTNKVVLTTLPDAIAYRRKAPAGGAAVIIVRADQAQPGIAAISKSTGGPIVMANTPKGPYPDEAFQEAIELTAGMPYHKQGKPAAPEPTVELPDGFAAEDEGALTEAEAEVVVDADEYQKVVDAYTDNRDRLSYPLMNKEMIQFAHRSPVVARMATAGASEREILDYIVGTKFRNAAENRNLTDEQVAAMAQLIDEVSPKGAFKELTAKIRSILRDAKMARRFAGEELEGQANTDE